MIIVTVSLPALFTLDIGIHLWYGSNPLAAFGHRQALSFQSSQLLIDEPLN